MEQQRGKRDEFWAPGHVARVLGTWARQLAPDRHRQTTDGSQRLHIYEGFSTARHNPS